MSCSCLSPAVVYEHARKAFNPQNERNITLFGIPITGVRAYTSVYIPYTLPCTGLRTEKSLLFTGEPPPVMLLLSGISAGKHSYSHVIAPRRPGLGRVAPRARTGITIIRPLEHRLTYSRAFSVPSRHSPAVVHRALSEWNMFVWFFFCNTDTIASHVRLIQTNHSSQKQYNSE